MTNWTFEAFDDVDINRLILEINLRGRNTRWQAITVVSDVADRLVTDIKFLSQVQGFIRSAENEYVYFTGEDYIALLPVETGLMVRKIFFRTPEEALTTSLTDTVFILGDVDIEVYRAVDYDLYTKNVYALSNSDSLEAALKFILESDYEKTQMRIRMENK